MSEDDRSELHRLRAEALAELERDDPVNTMTGQSTTRPTPPPPTGFIPPPMGYAPPPPSGRLERDPNGPVGGVASGFAHYFGLDPVLVRLGFVALTIASGIGLFAYIVAWVIMPKARYPWAPYSGAAADENRRRNGLVVVMAVIGVLLAFSGGWIGKLSGAALLIGGGLWLLNQRSQVASTPQDTMSSSYPGQSIPAGSYSPQDTPPAGFAGTGYGSGFPPYNYPPYGVGHSPPAPRRRLGYLVGFGLLAFIGVAVAIGVIGASIGFDPDDFEAGEFNYMPTSGDTLPDTIEATAGEVLIDLSHLTPEDLAEGAPHEIDIDLTVGEVSIIAPSDIPTVVNADYRGGEVTNELPAVSPDDALVIINVHLEFGEVIAYSA